MNINPDKNLAFINYLQELEEKGNSGALAALRHGLGKMPGEAPTMFQYVIPYLPNTENKLLEIAYYTIASLFAYHPQSTEKGNMGDHLRVLKNEDENAALDKRFTILLATHIDDLPVYLRQATAQLKAKDIAVNWHQLIQDILNWNSPQKWVQKTWANAFWKITFPEKPNKE